MQLVVVQAAWDVKHYMHIIYEAPVEFGGEPLHRTSALSDVLPSLVAFTSLKQFCMVLCGTLNP
jgi:hypothetical protein